MSRPGLRGCCGLVVTLGLGCAPSGSSTDAPVRDSGSDAAVVDASPSAMDASRPDAGRPASIDASPQDASAPEAGASTDGDVPRPDDDGPTKSDTAHTDAGCGGDCPLPDLIVKLGSASDAIGYRTVEISEDDCELYEGCVGGLGTRALLEISFSIDNVGAAPIELGRPFENPLYSPSFCQDSYVLDGFFGVEVRDASGNALAQGALSTSCIAGEGGEHTCRAQGLGVAQSSAQPISRCDFLDVTSIPSGHHTLVVTANPDRVIAEADHANNSAELAFDFVSCAGTVCGGVCCPSGVACVEQQCMLPDLRINERAAAESLFITHDTFGQDSCEVEEVCVGGSGRRRLLEFEGRIENWGPGDLSLGTEANNPLFELSSCHEHYHFRDFTDYRLMAADGSVAAFGHKQSFCLVNMVQIEGAPPTSPIGVHPPPGETGCNLLHAGWADIYGVGTPCQWVDITDVPPGDYTLELTVNPEGRVLEADESNNSVHIPVHIDEDLPCEAGTVEVCGDNLDQDCDDLPDDWDPDCQVCDPGDPYCQHVVQVSDNGSCDTIYDMTEQATFSTWIEHDDAPDVSPSCAGGGGGDVFFGFALESEQVVYLGTLDSSLDTVLSVYRDACDGEALRCEDDACEGVGGQFVDVLPAGYYVVAVSAKHAGDSGNVRLKFQHADGRGVIVLNGPGVYEGNSLSSDDTVDACAGDGSVDGGLPDGGAHTHGTEPSGGSIDGRDDIYAFASCYSPVIVSTCGTSEFDSLIDLRRGSLDADSQTCSRDDDDCSGSTLGTVVTSRASPGLHFIVVDGKTQDAAGLYQMSLVY